MFTFDASGGVGKKIVATSLETSVPTVGGRRLSIAALQSSAAASSSGAVAAPATPLVEKMVVVPVYPQPTAPATPSVATAGGGAVSSEATVTSPVAEGQNPPTYPTATQRRISFVVQEDVAAVTQVSKLVSDSLCLNDEKEGGGR